MSYVLYQLHADKGLPPGACVFVNGPHDTFGYVVNGMEEIRDGFQLYLIRGTGTVSNRFPVHDTVTFTDYSNSTIKATSSYDDLFCDKCHRKL